MDKLKVWRRWRLVGSGLLLLIPITSSGLFWWLEPAWPGTTSLLLVLVQIAFITLSLLAFERVFSGAASALTKFQVMETSQFDTLFDRSPVPNLKLDRQGIIKLANPAAIKFLRGSAQTLPGVRLFDLLALPETGNLEILVERIKGGDTITDRELNVVTVDGSETKVALLSVYQHQFGEEYIVSLLDITEQKKIDTAKSEFVALATHQLRTPIAALRFNYELLERSLRQNKTPDQERYLQKIERNIHRMIALINDFLSVSKLELGTFATSREEIDLAAFCQSIADEYAGKVAEKQLALRLDLEPAPLAFMTDQRLLHVIVSNLVSNAVKYVNPNGTVTLSYRTYGDRLELIVSDDGIGIPEEELPKLFTKFYRATNAQSHQTEGTGLGLYIVKQAVEQLGGTISVTSDTDTGAVFVVNLPLQ